MTRIAFAAKRHWGYPEPWVVAWGDSLTLTPEFVSANLVYAAASLDGRSIAFYALVGDANNVQLEHLWVAPAHIGHSHGRRLFSHACDVARTLSAAALLIDSDPNAAPFYEKMGAKRVGVLRADVCGERRDLPQLRYDLGVR